MQLPRALILALTASVALSACGAPTPAAGPAPTTAPVAPTAIEAPAPASVAPTSAAGDVLSGEDLDALVAAARTEGKVVVYSFTSRIAKVEKAFEAAYPDIDLVGVDISSTEQITRIKAELEANAAGADVAYISDAPIVFGELVQAGALIPFVPPQFADRVPAAYQQPLLANRLSTKVLMYNEAANPDGPPVSNLWELTQPEWAGKVIMVDPLVRGDYLDLMTEFVLQSDAFAKAYEELYGRPIELTDGAQNAGEQFIRQLFANDLVLVDDTDAVNAAIGPIDQTDPPLGFTTYSDRRDNEDEGWALQVANDVAPAPGIIFPAFLGVVKNAEHPAAARLLIHFMMGDDTPEGGPSYAPFYVPGDYATRTDIVPHPDAIPLDKFRAWAIDPVRTLEIRQKVADLILTLQ
ncbi:MAG: ABC transporter substrate-binding protein [Chloroflexales bacterium]|nr:ABC transporter substrate-binding protein [Chloroflexales bacterium]